MESSIPSRKLGSNYFFHLYEEYMNECITGAFDLVVRKVCACGSSCGLIMLGPAIVEYGEAVALLWFAHCFFLWSCFVELILYRMWNFAITAGFE